MTLAFSRGGAAVALCAAALLTLSACSEDSDGSAESTSAAAESSTVEATAAALDVRAEDLMLPESAFPPGGEYVLLDKAAIDADSGDDPDVTPAVCAALADDEDGTDAFDKAKVEVEYQNGITAETEVILGQAGSFEKVQADIEACPAMTMRVPMDDGGEAIAEMENSIEDVVGSTVPAKTIVSTGTMTLGDQSVPVTIRSTGAYVEGTTVSVQMTLIGDVDWGAADDEAVVDLLNQQVALVEEAAAQA